MRKFILYLQTVLLKKLTHSTVKHMADIYKSN